MSWIEAYFLAAGVLAVAVGYGLLLVMLARFIRHTIRRKP